MAMFAKYDGIDGESTDANHNNWIDLLSLEWGADRLQDSSTGQGRRRSAAVVEDMVLTSEYEKSCPKLLERCLEGQVIPQLDIELTATYGGARATYLKYELKNVVVVSYHISASGNEAEGPPVVVIANRFEEIKVTYIEFDNEGSNRGNVETDYKVRRTGTGSKKPKDNKK